MDETLQKCKIYYYAREKLFHSMLRVCEESLDKFKGNVSFIFYKSIALLMCNCFYESTSKLESLQLEENLGLASLIALAYVHEMGELKDADAFPNLYSQIKKYQAKANATDLMESAFVSFVFEKYQTAHEYIEKSVQIDPNCLNLSLKGWIELRLLENNVKGPYKPRDCFEMSLNKDAILDAILGLSEVFCNAGKFDEALTLLNKSSTQYSDVHFSLVEMLKLFFASQDWDRFANIYKQIQSLNEQHPEAMLLQIVKLCAVDAKYQEAGIVMDDLFKCIEKIETQNSKFLHECAVSISRVCDRDASILKKTYKFAEMSVQISQKNWDMLSELGYQCYLQGRYKDAINFYKLVVTSNEMAVSSLVEMTICELYLNGKSTQLQGQIEFLVEVQENQTPQLKYLASKIADDLLEAKKLLNTAIKELNDHSEHLTFSAAYLTAINPDFLLTMVKEMLVLLEQKVDENSALISHPDVLFLIDVVKKISKRCPGLFTASFLLAKLYYLVGNLNESQNLLNKKVQELEKTPSSTYLLLAQIHIKQGFHESAKHNLEIGLSNDFTVRDNALYHFLMGLVLKKYEKFDDSINSFLTALNYFNTNRNSDLSLNLKKVLIYKELIDTYLIKNQPKLASDFLERATDEFKGTSNESSVLLMSSDFSLRNGDTKNAISMLNKISNNDPCYVQAKIKLANIMLEKRRDKNAYLNCYKEIVRKNNTAESYVLLGDAYLNITEPEEAITAYEKSFKMNPSDPHLASKMGKALILTHRYKKACEFYKESLKNIQSYSLKEELVELYIMINELEKAEEFISSEIKTEEMVQTNDLASLKFKTKLLKLLAEIYIRKNNFESAIEILKNAVVNQGRVRKILSFEKSEVPQNDINLSVDLNMKIADLYAAKCDYVHAIVYQKEALSLQPNNQEVLGILAKTYVQINEIDKCQELCSSLLKLDPNNETALILQADIAFHNTDFETSASNFSNLVSKNPLNWKALERLIETSKRLGNIERVSQYLTKAEQILDSPEKNTGYCYCSGLYNWFSGNLNAALRHFNIARQDPEWNKNSLLNMIEICLSSDDDIEDTITTDDVEYKDSRSMALKTAERLLKELKQQTSGEPEYQLKCRLLTNFHLLAMKEKTQIEKALEDFVAMASEDAFKEHAGVVYGLAMAHVLLKQPQRAKTQLKRLTKVTWTYEKADYLEKCWLLHADFHMHSSKYELASELLKKILKYNGSCIKAYENLGLILEKEQNYKEAVNYYKNAWRISGKSNAAIGYKLAFCYMKCKRYADAIDISQDVLGLYPDYPKIKKDILDKSINNLRT